MILDKPNKPWYNKGTNKEREEMKMIIKKQLAERVEYLRKITGVDWVVGYWNGYAHIYDKNRAIC